MLPTTPHAVFEALAAGLLPRAPFKEAVQAVAADRDSTKPLEVVTAAQEPSTAHEDPALFDPEAELGRDELNHLLEALAL